MSAPTLRERARGATSIARRVTETEGQQLLAGSTEELARALHDEAARIRETIGGLAELDQADAARDLPDTVKVAIDAARALLGEQTTENLNRAREAHRYLRSRVEEVRATAASSWTAHKEANPRPSIDEDYLRQLARAGFDVAAIESIVATSEGRLELLGHRVIPQAGERDEWDRHVALLRDASRDIAELAPPEVRAFLGAAVGGGASMELLTPEVLRFLNDRGLAASFKVVRR